MRLRPALLALLILAGSCSRRERANPLDGENPRTGGAPEGFNAIAGETSVSLHWNARPDLPIDGFQLLRFEPGDSLFRLLGPVLPNSTSQFVDSGARSGLEYHYRLYYVIRGALGERFAEDLAAPGPLRPWIVDAGGGRLIRLSPDGRDVALQGNGFGESSGLAVTPGLGPVWVSDPLSGIVDIVDPGDLLGPRLRGIPKPSTMALDPIDESAWICDVSGSVQHYLSSGAPASPASISLLDDPEGVATSPRDGALWVAEFAGARVRRFGRDGTPLGARALLNPIRVAVDSTNGDGWVTSVASGYVWLLSPALVVLDSLRFQAPFGIALDWRRRTAWIVDPDTGELLAVNMDTRTVRFRIGGLGVPRDVAVDLSRGDAWIVSAATGQAFRYSASGVLLATVGDLGAPAEVRLDPGVQ